METRSVKERILDELRVAPRSKEELLGQFEYEPQQRGAASILAYLVKVGQAEITADGLYRLTGREPQKAKKKRDPVVEVVEAEPSGPELEWALWHDGDLLLRRGEVSLVLTQEERDRLLEWLPRVAA